MIFLTSHKKKFKEKKSGNLDSHYICFIHSICLETCSSHYSIIMRMYKITNASIFQTKIIQTRKNIYCTEHKNLF